MFTDTAHVDPPSTPVRTEPPGPARPDHRELRRDEFWRGIPAYQKVCEEEFRTHTFQNRHTVTNARQLRETLDGLVPQSFYEDLEAGVAHAPMALRISPYLLSLIDWRNPQADPIRTQFLPLRSQQRPDHPMLQLDSLHEQEDSPVPGLTHRYRDKALFLPQDSCPVYCRFCTRSYAVGADTPYDFRAARPIGDLPLDTCYADLIPDADGATRITFAHPDGSPRLTLILDAHYRFAQVYSGDNVPDPAARRRGLAIEPMTCPANAFNSGDGLITLQPGATFRATWTLHLD